MGGLWPGTPGPAEGPALLLGLQAGLTPGQSRSLILKVRVGLTLASQVHQSIKRAEAWRCPLDPLPIPPKALKQRPRAFVQWKPRGSSSCQENFKFFLRILFQKLNALLFAFFPENKYKLDTLNT